MLPDLFDKRLKSGNFSFLNNETDHYFIEPRFETPVGGIMRFQGKNKIVWSTNNYLGIAGEPTISKKAINTIKQWGMNSPIGSRLMSGDTERHAYLEEKFSEYAAKESALLCSFGYLGIIGAIPALVGPGDSILIDSMSTPA